MRTLKVACRSPVLFFLFFWSLHHKLSAVLLAGFVLVVTFAGCSVSFVDLPLPPLVFSFYLFTLDLVAAISITCSINRKFKTRPICKEMQ